MANIITIPNKHQPLSVSHRIFVNINNFTKIQKLSKANSSYANQQLILLLIPSYFHDKYTICIYNCIYNLLGKGNSSGNFCKFKK